MNSTFPPCEPPSFGSRPTPIGSRPSEDSLEQRFWDHPPIYSAAPPEPSLAPPPPRVVSPARLRFAKTLFMTMFGGMAALLVYSLVVHLAQG